MNNRIIWLEDEKRSIADLTEYLHAQGDFSITIFEKSTDALAALLEEEPDLLIVNLLLGSGKGDGLSIHYETSLRMVCLMNCLVIRVFAVGNADCLLLEMPNQELGVVDFCRRSSLSEHPLSPPNQCQPPKVIFVCLTHPHSDHMTGMESILDLVAANNGEFWHTVYDMAEVLELYASPRVAEASRRSLTQELEQLANLASAVADKFPAERIRFISAESGTSERILSTEEIDI